MAEVTSESRKRTVSHICALVALLAIRLSKRVGSIATKTLTCGMYTYGGGGENGPFNRTLFILSDRCSADHDWSMSMDTDVTAIPDEVDAKASNAQATPSKRQYEMLVMAASLGGIKAVGDILVALPIDFPAPVAVVLHRTVTPPNHLPELPVKLAQAGETMNAGLVMSPSAEPNRNADAEG
jgi:hypothetical protein